jgi:hypothetical protein
MRLFNLYYPIYSSRTHVIRTDIPDNSYYANSPLKTLDIDQFYPIKQKITLATRATYPQTSDNTHKTLPNLHVPPIKQTDFFCLYNGCYQHQNTRDTEMTMDVKWAVTSLNQQTRGAPFYPSTPQRVDPGGGNSFRRGRPGGDKKSQANLTTHSAPQCIDMAIQSVFTSKPAYIVNSPHS